MKNGNINLSSKNKKIARELVGNQFDEDEFDDENELEDDEDDIENIRFAFADENQIAHDPRGIPSFEQS